MDNEQKKRLIALRDNMKSYGYMDGVEELESIFPEIVESEDERIRTWCIAHFKECFRVSKDNLEFRQYLNNNVIPWLEKQKEQKSRLTVKGNGVYKICPRCKSRMIRDISKVYTSMPPQYGYNCPNCGTMEFDTVMYDNPEMEEQNPTLNEDDEHYELEEFAKIVRGNLTGISRTVLELFENKYLQLTGNKMFGGYKD